MIGEAPGWRAYETFWGKAVERRATHLKIPEVFPSCTRPPPLVYVPPMTPFDEALAALTTLTRLAESDPFDVTAASSAAPRLDLLLLQIDPARNDMTEPGTCSKCHQPTRANPRTGAWVHVHAVPHQGGVGEFVPA